MYETNRLEVKSGTFMRTIVVVVTVATNMLWLTSTQFPSAKGRNCLTAAISCACLDNFEPKPCDKEE